MSNPEVFEPERSTPISTRRKVGIAAAVLFLLYSLVGYLVVPSVVASQLEQGIESQTGTRPSLASVSFDPFGWRLEVHGFAMPDPSNEGDAIAFSMLAVDVSILDLLIANLALEEIVLVDPRIEAVIDESGQLNFLAFVPEASEETEAPEVAPAQDEGEGGLLVVTVDSVRIERGDIRFADRSQDPPFEVAIAPLDLEVEGFTTRAGGASPYALSVRVGEETTVSWNGTVGLDPIRSEGELALERFDLRLPWDFLSDRLAFEVAEGTLHASARYAFDLSDELGLTVEEAMVGLRDVRVLDPALEEPVVLVPSLEVSGVEVHVDGEGLASLTVADVELEGARVRSHIASDGDVHLATLFTPIAPEGVAAAEHEESVAAPPNEEEGRAARVPAIRVDRVALSGVDISIQDRSPARPVDLAVAPLDLVVTGYRSRPDAELGLELAAGLGEGGRLSLTGPLTLDPLATRLAIELDGFALGPFQPYMEDVARLEIPSAALGAKLDVDVRATPDAGPMAITAVGWVQLDDLLTIDRRLERPFVEWKRLRFEGLDYASAGASGEASDRVRIEEIGLAGALAHVVIDREGGTNLESIFGGASAEDAPVEAPSESTANEAPGPRIEIEKITLDAFGADLDDRSQEPHFEISLDALSGAIEGLSSENDARARVDLNGKVDKVAPVRIAGQINPLSGEAYTDLRVTVEGVSLPSFTPYSGRFVGLAIDRGKLALDLDYKLNARHLEASNLVQLDQFEFGDKVDSDDATSLPVGLAVAVMRDTSGNIAIPLPIEGDIDDPDFSILGLVGQALVNVVTKVATSPFAAVAGLVGASGDDLAQVAFTSGSPRISEVESTELASLVPILVERPALHLEIRGRADPVADARGLRREKIEAVVRLDAYERMSSRAREQVGDPAAVVLDLDDRLDGLDRLTRARLGQRARDLVPSESLPPRGEERDRVVSEAALDALAAEVELAESDWRRLARARAAAIQGALLASAEISADRLYLTEVEIGPAADGQNVTALLQLTTN
ncbi:MAG: hypothetical protein CL931_12175 [Deltaproteobacteria bacterium]|nr:hypothetical protein [Deltaproteobacteria bacterium]